MIEINGKTLKHFVFPGGESHVCVEKSWIMAQTEIVAHLDSADNIMTLLLAIDAIYRIDPDCQINLKIPYFPYARQDRVCRPGEALSVKVMAELINRLRCHQVTLYDPHSEVVTALVDRCKIKTQAEIVIETRLIPLIDESELILVSPDAGAEKKVRELTIALQSSYPQMHSITASKIRDSVTGQIRESRIHESVEGKNLLILDDICDGGSTFIELAKILKQAGANRLYLYVTHGIYSKGIEELCSWFERLYCYNLMNQSLLTSSQIFLLK